MEDKQRGLTVIEAVLVVATVAVILFVGFAIYQANQDVVELDGGETPMPTEQQSDDEVPEAPEIENEADLEEAAELLEDVGVEDESAAESNLEAEADNF